MRPPMRVPYLPIRPRQGRPSIAAEHLSGMRMDAPILKNQKRKPQEIARGRRRRRSAEANAAGGGRRSRGTQRENGPDEEDLGVLERRHPPKIINYSGKIKK